LTILIFLNFLFRLLDMFLFLSEIRIFLKDIFELQMPLTTDDAINPVFITPNLISI